MIPPNQYSYVTCMQKVHANVWLYMRRLLTYSLLAPQVDLRRVVIPSVTVL